MGTSHRSAATMLYSKSSRSSTELFITALAITSIASCDAFLHTSYERRKVSGSCRNCASNVDNAVEDTTAISPLQTTSCFQYVAKTTESFKLADLYWLQANVMAYCQRNSQSTVQKLAFHRPTASLLLGYNETSNCNSDQALPFPTNRVQYVGAVVASGATAQNLIKNIKEGKSPSISGRSTTNDCNPSWTLDCDTFEPLAGRKFTTSMLVCALSCHLSGEPVLEKNDIDDETIAYLLLETSNKLYLVEKLPVDNQMYGIYNENVNDFRQEWSRRPYQYSGAVNIDIAISVVDMLRRLLSKNGEDLNDNKRIRLLDPTVGSGTFLAAAAKLWNDQNSCLELVGVDSNPKCSEGTSKNLCKLLNVESSTVEEDSRGKSWTFSYADSKSEIPSRATIYCGDSVGLLSSASLDGAFDCVVSNLPWNRNTFEYKQETGSCTSSDILKQIAEVIKPGMPVVVVSGSNDPADSFNAKRILHSLGFDTIGEVSIPPAGFSLPESGKKKKSNAAAESTKRNSNCVVTVAIAPC